jgi:hypothetical protein
MIQPGHGTVLYNKQHLHLVCVGRTETVNYKICTHNGTVIAQNRMDRGSEVYSGYYVFYKEISLSSLTPDTDYYVSYWYEDADSSEPVVIFNAFTYMPVLEEQYGDYPYLGNWATKADVETCYLGNKKMIMYYCTEVPEPNPRGLFVGCEDYVEEFIKNTTDADWGKSAVSFRMYYWYDENEKLFKVGEEE